MTRKPVIRREVAQKDIESAVMHYLDAGGESLALGFIDAVEAAIEHIEAHPSAGSGRYADWAGIKSLRFWPVQRFPYLIFYIERTEQVDVWRVLHGHRDIPAWLPAEDEIP